MKNFEKFAAQGDVLFERIDPVELPNGLEVVTPTDSKNVIAHSETGHNHTMLAEREDVKTTLYRLPEELYECFLVVDGGDAVLEHERSFDTHEAISFSPGTYRIRRQREYTPEGYRRAAD